MSINTVLKEAMALQQGKENENTWSKINDVLVRLMDVVKTKEEAATTLRSINELVLRSIQSDRSKLSGTAMNFAKSCIVLLKSELEMVPLYLAALIKVCGKSNKVFYSRGEDALLTLCKNVNIRPYFKFFNEHSASANKNIRMAIFRGIRDALDGDFKDFRSIITRGRTDACVDVREICKSMMEMSVANEALSGVASEEKSHEMRDEPNRDLRRPVRPFVVSRVEIEKKELVSRFSPMRKQSKIDSEGCDRIKELEKQIKDITEDIKPNVLEDCKIGCECISGNRVVPDDDRNVNNIVLPEISGDHEGAIGLDDLTPIKLDRYLNKYRKEYGEIKFKKEVDVRVDDGIEYNNLEEVDGGNATIVEGINKDSSTVEKVIDCRDRDMGLDYSINDASELSLLNDEEVDDLSKSLANFSVTEPGPSSLDCSGNALNDVEVESKSAGMVSSQCPDICKDVSVNPYSDLEDRDLVQQTLRYDYTIANSGEAVDRGKNDEDDVVFASVEGSSIHESTIVVDSSVRKDDTGRNARKTKATMMGNRFSGLMFMSESSGEETVFSNKSERVSEDRSRDDRDFTTVGSFVQANRDVFRKNEMDKA